MLFPGDAVFSYVEQARNNPKNSRVYVLKIAQNNQVIHINLVAFQLAFSFIESLAVTPIF